MKVSVDYDRDNDILYFYPDERSVDFSVDYDGIILDISGNNVVGIEIMDASEKFGLDDDNLESVRLILDSIKDAHMKVKYDHSSILVKLGFVSFDSNTKENMLVQVPIKREMMVGV
jgi:uncharacterized protein YuzE|tara:strand:- start:64 stop:411 length:348 start_codon:yes stop_codon:yes gene_type:complete